MTSKHKAAAQEPARAVSAGKYRDRPADEGKHGDGADEPNAGIPTAPNDTPGRPKESGSRQQTSAGQSSQTGAAELGTHITKSHKAPAGRNRA